MHSMAPAPANSHISKLAHNIVQENRQWNIQQSLIKAFSFGTWKVMTGRVWIFRIIPLLTDRADCFSSFLPCVCITSSQVWFWHFVNIFEFHFWRCDEWDEFDHIWFCRRQCKYLRGSPWPGPITSHCPSHSHNSAVTLHLTAHWAGLLLSSSEIYAGYIGVVRAPGPTHSHLSPVPWWPELDTGSLPKWDNGNYRTLTNVSSYRKLQTHTDFKQEIFHRYFVMVSKETRMEFELICQMKLEILDDFHLFVVTKF